MVSWLDTSSWIDRTSELAIGAAVTVEPESESAPGSVDPPTGSFWAEVVELPVTTDSERQVYGVRGHGPAETTAVQHVERQRLRARVLKTTAFVYISNDKTHDSIAAQTFIKATLTYLLDNYVSTGMHLPALVHHCTLYIRITNPLYPFNRYREVYSPTIT